MTIHTTLQAKARTRQAAYVMRLFRAKCKREGKTISHGLLQLMWAAVRGEANP